jgi:hypothetical protein
MSADKTFGRLISLQNEQYRVFILQAYLKIKFLQHRGRWISIAKTDWLLLFSEMIYGYFENTLLDKFGVPDKSSFALED